MKTPFTTPNNYVTVSGYTFADKMTFCGRNTKGEEQIVEYIRKDALLEWAENWGKYKLRTDEGFLYAMELLINKLNSL